VGPEARAVLAHAPGLLLEASYARGGLELALALSRSHVLDGIEAREVLADDLVGAPALDLLRAAVPRGHAAFAIERDDGVVLYALDHQAKALLGVALFDLRLEAQPPRDQDDDQEHEAADAEQPERRPP